MKVREKLIVGDFIEGSAIVYKKEKMNLVKGLMFENGSTKFFDVIHFGDFKDGLALIDTGKYAGFINRRGNYIIPPKYNFANDFSEGRTFVLHNDRSLLINSDGERINDFEKYFVTGKFSGGFAQIGEMSDDGESIQISFSDKNGEIIGFINEPRKIHNPVEIIDENDDLSCGLARFNENGKYGYRTVYQEIIIPPEYDYAGRFHEGLALVNLDQKAGFVDWIGNVKIPFEFDFANSFSEGLAAVEYNGKMGCINQDCETVIPFEFDWLGEFRNGLVDFCNNDKWGLMDKQMNIVVPERYDSISHFIDGICEVSLNGHRGFLDKNSKTLFSDFLIGCEYNHLLN